MILMRTIRLFLPVLIMILMKKILAASKNIFNISMYILCHRDNFEVVPYCNKKSFRIVRGDFVSS